MKICPAAMLVAPFFLVISVPGGAQGRAPAPNEQPDDLLSTIKPGMTEAEIVAALGTPKGRAPTPWGDVIVTWELSMPSGSRQVRYVFSAEGKMLRMVPPPKTS